MTNVVASKPMFFAKIEIPRDLDPDDDLTALAQDMKQNGLVVPILVNHENRLIDGLRRLRAAQQLGWNRIAVISTSMYLDACAVLRQAREHGVEAKPLTGQRIFEIYEEMLPISRYTKTVNSIGVPRGKKRPSSGGRKVLVEALALPSTNLIQAISFTHRSLLDPDKEEVAARAIQMVSEGKLTYFGAETLLQAKNPFPGTVKSVREQEHILEEAVTTLGGVLRSLDSLGPLNPKLNRDKLNTRARELAQSRARLITFVRLLNKEIEKL